MDEYYEAISRLGAGLDRILGRLEPACAPRVQEVRLRSGRLPYLSGEKATYIFGMAGWADQRRRAYQSARGKWRSVFFPSAAIPYMPMSTT